MAGSRMVGGGCGAFGSLPAKDDQVVGPFYMVDQSAAKTNKIVLKERRIGENGGESLEMNRGQVT